MVDTSNIECVRHALCMAYCCDKEVQGLHMVPNCLYCLHKYVYLTKLAAVTLNFNKQGSTKRTYR